MKKIGGKEVIIIAVIVVALVVIVTLTSKRGEGLECRYDSDCVKVRTTCCPCNMGGEEQCVAKSEEGFYQNKLKEECTGNNVCIALYACVIESCGCVEGKCVGFGGEE